MTGKRATREIYRRALSIYTVYRAATDGERLAGAMWYRQANSISRVLSVVARTNHRAASGVIAALSPLNKWEDNVSDAFSLARDITSRVRTTSVNRWKAVRILAGDDPDLVLRGRKVRSFWACILSPMSAKVVAVDRHLHRAALGWRTEDGEWISPRISAPVDDDDYTTTELAYAEVASAISEPVPSVASTVWMICRAREGVQRSITWPLDEYPLRPVCCEQSMQSHGRQYGNRRWRCPACKHVRVSGKGRRDEEIRPRLCKTRDGWSVAVCDMNDAFPGYPLRRDERGRWMVQVSVGHPYANSGGWQYLSRYLVMDDLGRPLSSNEHVHHIDGDVGNDTPSNLEVISVEFHGKLHAWAIDVAGYRDSAGRFVEHDEPAWPPRAVHRDGPIIQAISRP